MPTFPDVPNVPGVPPVLRSPTAPTDQPDLMDVDTVTVTGDPDQPEWGLFLNGQSVIQADNVTSFEYKQDWTISDYQIEQGGFQSYDKVSLPFDARLSMSCGGSASNRAAFLNSIDAIAGDLNLYTVVTPEKSYVDVNVQHYDFRRTSERGVGLIEVNLYLLEIRESASQQFSSTNTSPASTTAVQDPGAASKVNGGTVQAIPAGTPGFIQ